MNNKKIVTIIFALCLIGFFFLPYFSLGPFGTISGFDIVTGPGGNSGDVETMIMKYIFILIPLSGIMLLIGAVNNGNYFLGRGLWALLPLLTLIYFIVRSLMGRPGQNSPEISELIKTFGYGFWATLGVSLALAFYWPKGK
jgi:hypothetical protein